MFYAFALQGNVAQRADATGAALSSARYDAFGQRTSTASPSDPWGFGAHWGADSGTGLVLMTHRYYNPATGRFFTRDPMECCVPIR